MAAPAPFDEAPRDLNTAPLPTHYAAKNTGKDGCQWAEEYAISASVKSRAIMQKTDLDQN